MFDARAAKALRPGDHLTFEMAPGLRLVATETRRTWVYRYKSPVDSRMRQTRLGHWPAMGFAAALVAWQQQRDARMAGADPAAERRKARAAARDRDAGGAYTVRRAADDYLRSYRGTVIPKTYAEAERILRSELGELEHLPAAQVTRAQAFDLLEAMHNRPVVAGRLRQLLGAVWDRALDAGRLPAETPNWWRLVLRGRLKSKGKIVGGEHQGRPEKRALTEAEVGQLLHFLPNFSRTVSDALTLYLWTGCRGAEIVAAEAHEVAEEPDGLWWTIPRDKLKMRDNPLTADLRVPLVGRAEEIVRRRVAVALELQAQRENAGAAGADRPLFLFPSPGRSGHVEQRALGHAVWWHMPGCRLRPESERPRLPIASFAPHDLRRTSRTILSALGCPAEVAEAILGHQAPGVRAIYDRHGYDVERRLWLTRLSERLEQVAAQAPAASR